ncbi:TetR/AcrR family transcriptional regulator [Burkholderia sp. F1]|uniref:TetR/AcrR family transcriptional regulator n=1 Tax=Burkholderia sp. F1 TaxID=3366817 RepID=UPI003D73AE99
MTMPIKQHIRRSRRTSSAAVAGSHVDGLRAQGLRTRNRIVGVAKELLLQGGPLEFSQRAVALAAGISVSNLQYYFPTRLAVLRAVIEPVIDTYLDDLKSALSSDTTPQAVLDEILQRSLRDAKSPEYCALIRHFLSFAATDPECSKFLDEWYSTLTCELAKLLSTVNPKNSIAYSQEVATLLISMVDGLTIQIGTARNSPAIEARLMSVAHDLIYGMSTGRRNE